MALPRFAGPPAILQAGHWLAARLLARTGGRWEVRRAGDSGVGLWRIPLGGRRERALGAPSRRLALLPGLGDTPLSWMGVLAINLRALRAAYDEVVLMDFPGYSGFQALQPVFGSMDSCLASVADALDELRPATILGHSLGGWLTAHYATEVASGARPATRRPGWEGPETLILACPSGAFGPNSAGEELRETFARATREGFGAVRPVLFAREPRWFRLLAREFGQFVAREDLARFLDSIEPRHLVQPRLGTIRSRVWLLWGDQDAICPPEWVGHWTTGLGPSAAGAITLSGVGHSPHVENPLATAAILGRILRGQTVGPDPGKRWRIV